MIEGLCGFADLVRRHGGDVGSAELIDAARTLVLVDLADRGSVHRALALAFAWSTVHPELFDQLFDRWFSGADLAFNDPDLFAHDGSDQPTVTLDAAAADAARIHTDDAAAIEARDDRSSTDSATGSDAAPSPTPSATAMTRDDGDLVAATGDLAAVPPRDDVANSDVEHRSTVVELPVDPLAAELELARQALNDAVVRRRQAAPPTISRHVAAVTAPLTSQERGQLARIVRRLSRQLDGAPSWRRSRDRNGVVDLRRTMRRSVGTGGFPIDLDHVGRRNSAARVVVLVDLSMSVRGTARLVMHLVHRMRSMVGALRAFGFVDSCVSIDRGLRVADPAMAIENVFSAVDVDALSDPGVAFRQWWARWHHLVTPRTHVMFLSDGRCNGRDPALDIIDRATQRSASTLWISPEPVGAWTLGRGEMAQYGQRVDGAVSVRTIDDLEQVVGASRGVVRQRRPA
ncbi:MAG: VWA domain-containing protein [Actinomycetota bacterium]